MVSPHSLNYSFKMTKIVDTPYQILHGEAETSPQEKRIFQLLSRFEKWNMDLRRIRLRGIMNARSDQE